MNTKRKMQLTLSKETVRALSENELSQLQAGKPGGTVTTTLDPDCFYTTPSYYHCP